MARSFFCSDRMVVAVSCGCWVAAGPQVGAQWLMPLHILKLCVGAASIDDLATWQRSRLAFQKMQRQAPRIEHTTFQTPKRQAELLDGGSLYWVIKGVIQVRQRFTGFDVGTKDDGTACCLLLLDPELVPVRPVKRRPFQGWRYLQHDDAPHDLGANDDAAALAALSPQMRQDLASLGLL
jgi:hypothetical protein